MSILSKLLDRILGPYIETRVQNATKLMDDKYWAPQDATIPYATTWASHRQTIERCQRLRAQNPLAARLIELTTDFVIGEGCTLKGPKWATEFWRHPLNDMNRRAYELCDELTTTGELFIVLSTNPINKMSYVRVIPSINIDQIETDPNDSEREIRYHQLTNDLNGRWWPSKLDEDAPQIMLHYAINKPIGETRGRSDLAPLMTWLERYDLWLEDRVRINRYKGAYLWHVRIENPPPGILQAKQAQYATPPKSGSILVTDATERWEALQPDIKADDVEADGRALRLMIAAGAGIPLHFLAEGESATRATAREMGTPTYRKFAHRQFIFEHMLRDLVRTAAARAGHHNMEVDIIFDSVLALYPELAQQPEPPQPPQAEPEKLAKKDRPQPHKRWHTKGDELTCETCKANEAQGWIPLTEPYRSGHLNPPAHDYCRCTESYQGIDL